MTGHLFTEERSMKSCLLIYLVAITFSHAQGIRPGEFDTIPSVLFVNSDKPGCASFETLYRAVERVIDAKYAKRVRYFYEHLDLFRFADSAYVNRLALLHSYTYGRKKRPAVIVTLHTEAAGFYRNACDSTLHDIPLLSASIGEDSTDGKFASPVIPVRANFNAKATMELIKAQKPQVTTVCVVTGKHRLDRKWHDQVRSALGLQYKGIRLDYSNEFDFDTYREFLEKAPATAAVLYVSFRQDNAGLHYQSLPVFKRMVQRVEAPVYTVWSTFIGHGAVGGNVCSFELLGNELGEITVRLLKGTRPEEIAYIPQDVSVPMFDYRQLQKFSISEKVLPPAGLVRFKPVEKPPTAFKFILLYWMLLPAVSVAACYLVLIKIRRTSARHTPRQPTVEQIDFARDHPDPMCRFKRDGSIVNVNPVFASLVGKNPAELAGHNFYHILGRESVEALNAALASITTQSRKARAIIGQPGPRWIEWVVQGIFNERGDALEYVAAGRDITQQRLAEERLRVSESRHRFIAGITTDFVYGMSFDKPGYCRIAWASEGIAAITGFSAEEINAFEHGWLSLVAPEERAGITSDAELNDPEQLACEKQYRIITRNGELRVLSDRFIRKEECAEAGSFQHVGGIKDITKRISSVAAIQPADRAHQRSEKLTSLRQFAAGLADLLAHSCVELAGLTRDAGHDAADKTELLQNIDMVHSSLSRLDEQLYHFASPREFALEPLDMHTVIADVVAVLETEFGERVKLKQHLDANPPTVKGNREAVAELLVSVARYVLSRCDELVVQTENKKRDDPEQHLFSAIGSAGEYFGLSLIAPGGQIDREERDRMSEDVALENGPTQRAGVELAIAHDIVKSHGGILQTGVCLEQAFRVTILLPLHHEPSAKAVQSEDAEFEAWVSARILIIDDEEAVAEVASDIIEKAGYGAKTCSSAATALEIYRQEWQSIDAVLLDLQMPPHGGEEVFEKVRQVNPSARVLITSGFAANENVQKLLKAGANGFIKKPFRKKELVGKIEEIAGDAEGSSA
ncbi:MAG: response regulator [Chitinivibrionales bacterium]|nr:response regulator [Chitinivibrionales bacterium]